MLITGGAGYVGGVLVPHLLEVGHHVCVYDALFFGRDGLPDHPRLKVIEGDVRDTDKLAQAFRGMDCVLHLACISNDPSFELDSDLSRSINYDCFEPMVVAARAAGVRRFVYCSTSSVYGVSEQRDVTEDHPLVPLTLYNEFKGKCEPLLFRHASDDFTCVAIRPATVCGYSPRQRLDLSVNILTTHAVTNGEIKVFGGDQLRPNLHIQDMAAAYRLMIEAPHEKIHGQVFNIGYQNLRIREIADLVCDVVAQEYLDRRPIRITTTPTDDLRSYHINSDKIHRVLGYRPKYSVADAVRELCHAFKEGRLPNCMTDPRYYNVRRMQEIGAR